MPSPLNSHTQTPLLTLGQTALFATFDLSVLVDVALQGLKVLVVKKCYVSPVLKNLCHYFLERRQTYGFSRRARCRNESVTWAALFPPSTLLSAQLIVLL